jgi:hypothetical protein
MAPCASCGRWVATRSLDTLLCEVCLIGLATMAGDRACPDCGSPPGVECKTWCGNLVELPDG